MHIVRINSLVFNVPENWDELTLKQLKFLVKVTQQDVSVEELKVKMVLYCMGLHVLRRAGQLFVLRRGRRVLLLNATHICPLAQLMDYLIDEAKNDKGQPLEYYIRPRLTVNHFPKFCCKLKQFTGPDDGLFTIRFEQYIYLLTYMDAMQRSPEEIDKVLAILWHSGKQFDIERMEQDAKVLHRLPRATKMIMFWFVSACLADFSDQFPRLFNGGGATTRNVLDSQLRLLDTLAQGDMTKKDQVRQGILIDAFYTMDEAVRKQEEHEKQMQRMNKPK